MVPIWLKALLFVGGGLTAATGAAYVTGMLDPWLGRAPEEIVASAPETSEQPPQAQDAQGEAPAASGEVPLPDDPTTTGKQGRLAAPSFDLLRAEPDGSLLIAGKAPPEATVEVMAGDTVLTRATAGPEGDFVAVLDDPLAPGDYVLSLRATTPDNDVSDSTETAVVSIPETADGQVLALLQEPGAAAELVTVPEAPAAAETPDATAEAEPEEIAAADEQQPAGESEAAEAAGPAEDEAQTTAEPETAGEETVAAAEAAPDEAAEEPSGIAEEEAAASDEPEATPQPAPAGNVVVEAVEIEGDTVFVAGQADPGSMVRVYANALHLGDARTSQGGRFLVEAQRELPVGDYVIRADLLGADGAVLARAAVPFEREPGESIAAVAVAPEAPEPEAIEEDAASAQEAVAPAGEEAAEASDPAPAETGEEVALAPEAASPQGEAEEQATAEPEAEAGTVIAAAPAAEVAEESEITAPPLQRVDGAVIIRRGDNLWRLSRRVYGKGVRYSTIYLANQDQIRNPDLIWPGQVFTVPRQTEEGEEADMGAIGDQAVMPSQDETAEQ